MPAKSRPAKRPSSIDIAVGRNVRIWRMAKGLSQAQLANRLGVTFQQVQKYEVGSNRIGTGRLVKLAAILRIPIAALFDAARAHCRQARVSARPRLRGNRGQHAASVAREPGRKDRDRRPAAAAAPQIVRSVRRSTRARG